VPPTVAGSRAAAATGPGRGGPHVFPASHLFDWLETIRAEGDRDGGGGDPMQQGCAFLPPPSHPPRGLALRIFTTKGRPVPGAIFAVFGYICTDQNLYLET